MPHARSTLPLLTMATEARLACGTYLRVHYHWSVLVEGGDLRIKVKRTIWMQWKMAYGQRSVSLFRRTSRRHACVECHACLSRSFVRKSTVGSIPSENRVLLRRRQGLRSCARVLIAVLCHLYSVLIHIAYQIMPGTFRETLFSISSLPMNSATIHVVASWPHVCLRAFHRILFSCTCGIQLCPLNGFLFP